MFDNSCPSWPEKVPTKTDIMSTKGLTRQPPSGIFEKKKNIFVCFEFQCVYGLASEELNIWAYMASFGRWATGNKLRIAATSPDRWAGWGVVVVVVIPVTRVSDIIGGAVNLIL